ncbi:hypothetical protein CQW23_16554 [Capsicum baccatum]|uniref:Uncharacterized protein n=1 Tax=Capsicum baccatum TaxID=33114 RepID=A0A2G2WBH4_CAPBA|nr:hypothetical protein CQW23_16554 [Capsicum baccatum]
MTENLLSMDSFDDAFPSMNNSMYMIITIFHYTQAAQAIGIPKVGVTYACGHTGLIDKGMKYFLSMDRDYGIAINPKHYTCMIDLLRRAA